MGFNTNLSESEMLLLIKGDDTRTPSGAVKENWIEVQMVTLQFSTTSKSRISDNVHYTDYKHTGVCRNSFTLERGKYRLQDENGLYDVLDIKKIGNRMIFEFKEVEGGN